MRDLVKCFVLETVLSYRNVENETNEVSKIGKDAKSTLKYRSNRRQRVKQRRLSNSKILSSEGANKCQHNPEPSQDAFKKTEEKPYRRRHQNKRKSNEWKQ